MIIHFGDIVNKYNQIKPGNFLMIECQDILSGHLACLLYMHTPDPNLPS